MTDDQIVIFNALYQQACDKMEGLIILEGYYPKKAGFFEKLRIRKAIMYFNQALSIYPEHYQSLFFVGKLYQRLAEYNKSLTYFERAIQLEHVNHNIPQEASIVAMHLNQVDKALEYSKEALRRKPNDYALLGNHSMNLLIAGLDDEAKTTIDLALKINSTDQINQTIKPKITNVIAGKEERPTFANTIGG